jgi:hypothetical protein
MNRKNEVRRAFAAEIDPVWRHPNVDNLNWRNKFLGDENEIWLNSSKLLVLCLVIIPGR